MKARLPFSRWRKLSFEGWEFIVVFLSYSFLVYKLLTFDRYQELVSFWKQLDLSQFRWLLGVFLLLPCNWLMETFKWKKLISKVHVLSVADSLKAVLAGISSGFFTPNKVGELVGRIAFLPPVNRKSGITLTVLNSLTQNIVMAICGIPSCMLFFTYRRNVVVADVQIYLTSLIVGVLICAVIYFSLPIYSHRLLSGRRGLKISEFIACLSTYGLKDLMEIILLSFFRYLIFCTQFYLMLSFFDVKLELWQALLAIPTSYLFVTFTPSVAFSEVAVRSSFAVLFIGAFSPQVVNIALASIGVWTVNMVIPMLAGTVVWMKRPKYGAVSKEP